MNSHSNFFSRAGWVWLIAVASWVSPTARAADHQVLMTDTLEFSPSYLEIEVGDTVTWYNADDIDDHTSTSTTGLWNSGDVAPGEYYGPLLFDTPGTFNYRDIYYSNPDGTSGMIGTIVVKPASVVTPAVLTGSARLSNGSFESTITNVTAGKTIVVEVSTNLANWTGILTNLNPNTTLTFTDNAATGQARRFYRCYQIP